MRLSSTFEKVGRQFQIEFGELTRETSHHLTAGESREKALIDLLRKYLPQRVGADRGFVIDAQGNESQQIDIILYDKQAATTFEAAGVSYFPCETVLAIGEVKSDITSTGRLEDALSKIRSVKCLDRSNAGKNKPITGPGLSTSSIVQFNPEKNHRDQIFGFIFTQTTLTQESLIEILQEFNGANPRSHWMNLFCAFDQTIITYENKTRSIYPSAMDAATIAITDAQEVENLLLLFFCILATFVNEAHIARPDYFAYGSIDSTHVRSWTLGI